MIEGMLNVVFILSVILKCIASQIKELHIT